MGLSMGIPGQPDFDARALAGRRFHRERAADRPNPLLDDDGTFASDLEIRLRVASREPEAASVVVDLELPIAGRRAHAHEHGAGAAVLSYVDQRFLDDARDLAANARRQRQLVDLRHEMRGDAALLLKASDEI